MFGQYNKALKQLLLLAQKFWYTFEVKGGSLKTVPVDYAKLIFNV